MDKPKTLPVQNPKTLMYENLRATIQTMNQRRVKMSVFHSQTLKLGRKNPCKFLSIDSTPKESPQFPDHQAGIVLWQLA